MNLKRRVSHSVRMIRLKFTHWVGRGVEKLFIQRMDCLWQCNYDQNIGAQQKFSFL